MSRSLTYCALEGSRMRRASILEPASAHVPHGSRRRLLSRGGRLGPPSDGRADHSARRHGTTIDPPELDDVKRGRARLACGANDRVSFEHCSPPPAVRRPGPERHSATRFQPRAPVSPPDARNTPSLLRHPPDDAPALDLDAPFSAWRPLRGALEAATDAVDWCVWDDRWVGGWMMDSLQVVETG